MIELEEYIRVGTDYHRSVEVPLTKDTIRTMIGWNRQTLIDDFGKDAISQIKKYKGFCTIPSHTAYQREVGGFYNKYHELSYQPTSNGSFKNIEALLHHIFGDQYLLGLDYLTLIWRKPTQRLPVLCLVSDERNTGKTTFLHLLKMIFEYNMTLNTNEDFKSRFNSEWSGKCIIAVDEVELNRSEDSERIKNLSTAKYSKTEAKGKDRVEVEFFSKLIFCANKEENFIKTDEKEIRYWVRKIPTLEGIVDPDYEDKMKAEVASFTCFLTHRKLSTIEKTRMWFTKEQIYTEALRLLVQGNRTTIEKELEELIMDELAYFEIAELCYTSQNLVEMLAKRNVRVSNQHLSSILKDKFNLVPINSSYQLFRSDFSSVGATNSINAKGRFFKFRKARFTNKAVD